MPGRCERPRQLPRLARRSRQDREDPSENGYESWYGHLSRYPNLAIGQRVQQKQVIGYVGSTGLSTGPHLHFVLQKNGRIVNPSTMHAAAAQPIPRQAMKEFASVRDGLLGKLDPAALRVVTNEAL